MRANEQIDCGPIDGMVEAIGRGQDALLPILQAIQKKYNYLPEPALRRVCELSRITPSQIVSVATFYPQFRFKPPGKYNIQVCLGNSCHVGGAQNFMEAMKIEKNLGDGDTSPDQMFSLEGVGCLGCCAIAPVVVVNKDFHGRMNRVTFMRLVESLESSEKKS